MAADDLAAAAGHERVRVVVAVPAGVPDRDAWDEDGRDAGRAGAQAEVHVLVEQVDPRVEGAETAQGVRARDEAGGDGPADGPRPR